MVESVKLNILLIDSEPRWINFAKNSLVDFKIDVVANTDEAVRALKSKRFHLVIASSLQLEALEKIKRDYAEQPLLVATTDPNRNEEREAYLLGARRYFSKKFDPDSLKNEIDSMYSS